MREKQHGGDPNQSEKEDIWQPETQKPNKPKPEENDRKSQTAPQSCSLTIFSPDKELAPCGPSQRFPPRPSPPRPGALPAGTRPWGPGRAPSPSPSHNGDCSGGRGQDAARPAPRLTHILVGWEGAHGVTSPASPRGHQPHKGWDVAPALLAATPRFFGVPKTTDAAGGPVQPPTRPPEPAKPEASSELGGKVWAGRSLASPSPRRKSPPPRPDGAACPHAAFGAPPRRVSAPNKSRGGCQFSVMISLSPIGHPVPKVPPRLGGSLLPELPFAGKSRSRARRLH